MSRPDLVLVLGPPKCGTTSLHAWLAHHGEIQESTPKETYYFIDRDQPFFARRGTSFVEDGVDGFERFFDGPAEGRIRLESTTHHFASTTCREFVRSGVSEVASVMVVRDPAERIRSAFEYAKHNRGRISERFTFDDFVTALADGRREAIDDNVSDAPTAWALSRSLQTSDYGRWAEFWSDEVEQGSLVFVDFDDLVRRSAAVLGALARRWHLSEQPFAGFEPSALNATTRPSSGPGRLLRRLRVKNAAPEEDIEGAVDRLRALLPADDATVRAGLLDVGQA